MAHKILQAKLNFNLLNDELAIEAMEKPYFDKHLKAYNGDFWQKGQDVLLPPPSLKEGAQGIKAQGFLQNRYVSRNILLEVVGRVSSAFLGKGPNWNYVVDGRTVNLKKINRQQQDLEKKKKAIEQRKVLNEFDPIANQKPKTIPDPEAAKDPNVPPPDPEQKPQELPPGINPEDVPDPADLELAAKLEEIDKLLGEYWTTGAVGDRMGEAFDRRLVVGRGGLRIYIPAKYKKKQAAAKKTGTADSQAPVIDDPKEEPSQADQYVSFDNMADALKAIKVEFVDPQRSRLLTDDGELFSIVLYERRDDWNSKVMTKVIEYSFVDNLGRTFVGVFTDKDSGAALNMSQVSATETKKLNLSAPVDLDENTTFFETKGRPYVSDQMFIQNQLANLALTCGGFNIVDNGFGELLLTNADIEMEKVPDANAPGGTREVAKKLKRGGGVVNNFLGVEFSDAEGNETIMEPGVHWREPSSMQPFIDGYMLAYGAILEEGGQKYALISGDATASGESRIQAMSDFYLKIKKYKAEIDKMGSWVMTVILRLVAQLVNQQKEFENVSILFDSRIRIGNLTAAERTVVMAMQTNGLISKETARVILDVEDPGLEEDLIDKEQAKDKLMNPPPPPAIDEKGNPVGPGVPVKDPKGSGTGNPA